jgi:phosphate-selective porin OprO/OprP
MPTLLHPPTAPAGAHHTNSANAHRNTGRGRDADSMKPNTYNQHHRSAPLLILLTLFGSANSQDLAKSLDPIWALATLYKDDSNPILQEFKLRGRYQGQYHWLDGNQGSAEGWEDRRSRLGFDAKLFEKQLELRADFQSNDGFEDFYDRLVDAYIRWKPNPNLSITAGKTKPLIAWYDWLQSTNSQPTFERSQIFNQLRVDRATALTFEGSIENFTWQAGFYSNDTDREFGTFGGGTSYGAGIGWNLNEALGWSRADLRLDWLHSNHDADDFVLNRYQDILTATFWAREGPWELVLEGFHASGADGRFEDVAGFFIQPAYDLIPGKLQLVGRYTFSTGDGPASLDGQSRYERTAPTLTPTGTARGDTYHAFYLGTQYFIHGDKLKLLTGIEYSTLSGGTNADDYEGTTLLTGLRLSF